MDRELDHSRGCEFSCLSRTVKITTREEKGREILQVLFPLLLCYCVLCRLVLHVELVLVSAALGQSGGIASEDGAAACPDPRAGLTESSKHCSADRGTEG